MIIFNDFAGEVIALPEGVQTGFQVGDRVVGCLEMEKVPVHQPKERAQRKTHARQIWLLGVT
eukprot:2964862-Amphidinium_carterae.1